MPATWVTRHAAEHPGAQRLPRWQAVTLACHASLLIGVLPFICWGALAQPGHPHAGPHFVFAEPPLRHPLDAAPSRVAAGHSPSSGSHAAHTSQDVAGQSLPSTLLMTTLLQVLLSTNEWRISLRRFAYRVWSLCTASSVPLAVPTPPPRPDYRQFAGAGTGMSIKPPLLQPARKDRWREQRSLFYSLPCC